MQSPADVAFQLSDDGVVKDIDEAFRACRDKFVDLGIDRCDIGNSGIEYRHALMKLLSVSFSVT